MRISKSVGFAVAAFIAGSAGTTWSAPGGGVSQEIAALQSSVSTLQSQMSTLQSQVSSLQTLLAGVSRLTDPETSQDTLRFSAMNVQVVNGTGQTDSVNGLGNLIVGYNEQNEEATNDRSGSHVLVLGTANQYPGYGGLVAGFVNTLSGAYATVTGGAGNEASGLGASVTGGLFNDATGQYAAVNGGIENAANGFYCTITGGQQNVVDLNTIAATICGGAENDVFGFWATVGGGHSRIAFNDFDWVAGSLFEDN